MRAAAVLAAAVGAGLLVLPACGSSGDDTDRLPGSDAAPGDARPGGQDAGPDAPPPMIDAPPDVDAAIDAPPLPPPPQLLTVCGAGGGDFTTIGAAIAAAPAGSTLRVCPGTYREHLVIDGTGLTIIGDGGADTTIVDGGDSGTVVTVEHGGDLIVAGLTFTHGRTAAEGGGLRCDQSRLELATSVLDDNQAGAGGGDLYAVGCELTISSTRFSQGHGGPRGGGALLVESTGSVSASQFLASDATEGAGVASVDGSVELRGNTITGNAAGLRGGGVYHATDARLADNQITDNTAGWTGGGLHVVGHAPGISGNTITGNQSINDGGGVYLDQSAATLTVNTVSDNTSGDDGGGIRAFESMATLSNNTVERNRAGDGGGGIRVSHVPAMLVGNVVRANVAGGTGGGLDLDNDASTVMGGEVSGNQAGGSGGGIFAWLGPWNGLHLDGIEVRDNHAWQGGGLYLVDNFQPATLRHLRVTGNHASKGGGLMVSSTSFTITGSLFADNVATDRGGAVYAGASAPWQGIDGTGGACPCPPASPTGTIAFSVLARNQAPRGGGVWTTFPGLEVTSSIVFASDGAAVETSVGDGGDPPAVPAIRYSDVYPAAFAGLTDPTTADGNLAVDPQFVDATGGDFHLSAASPCVDAGAPDLVDGDGSRADMGMFGGAP
ncbi:MAG TPA: NosD domain-containing protein [Kofleriaceae bacterium]|nr:NosD domain-containing protein [Kofleriaceae bacterium]